MLSNLLIFDFETTGLDPKQDRVIELAAVKVINGKVASEFSTVVNSVDYVSDKITEITGITIDEVKNGSNELMAFKVLNHLMKDSVIVAHNAPFDMAFLHYTLDRLAGKTFTNNFIDTLTISRDRHFYPHKLEDMCSRYDIKLEGAHRALNDVHGCLELLNKFHDEKPVDEYINKLGYLQKYGAPKWYPEHAQLTPMYNRYQN
jgi:DNA polymerase-3 subunit epsilon